MSIQVDTHSLVLVSSVVRFNELFLCSKLRARQPRHKDPKKQAPSSTMLRMRRSAWPQCPSFWYIPSFDFCMLFRDIAFFLRNLVAVLVVHVCRRGAFELDSKF